MAHAVDGEKIIELISELVTIPSPSGNTDKVIDFVEKELELTGVKLTRSHKGGLIASITGKDDSRHRFLTGHVDTLGAMVKEVKPNGRLKLSKIGGFPWNMAEGEYCQIETADGKQFTGTILMHQTSVHVYKDAGKAERNDENIEVRIDEKVLSDEDVKVLGINVGDFVSFDPRLSVTPSGFVKSRHLDDKASVAILLHVINKFVEEQTPLPYTTHFLISNNEEIGYGGNSNIHGSVEEYVAVDMGAIGDGQTTDEYSISICAKDSSGPYNLKLRKHLVSLAEQQGLDYKVDIYPYYGSDASAALRAGYDIRHGLIGSGIDASHAYERTHRDSLVHTGDLIYYYLQSEMS